MKEVPDWWGDYSDPYEEFRSYKALVARHKRAERVRLFHAKALIASRKRTGQRHRRYRFAAVAVLVALGSFVLTWGLMVLKP